MSLLLLLSNPPGLPPEAAFVECFNGFINFEQPLSGEMTFTQCQTGTITFELQENGQI